MEVTIPFTSNARKYGYIIWPKRSDDSVRKMLGDREAIEVCLDNRSLGTKRIDWKYRRISVGSTHTNSIQQEVNEVHLNHDGSGQVYITPLR